MVLCVQEERPSFWLRSICVGLGVDDGRRTWFFAMGLPVLAHLIVGSLGYFGLYRNSRVSELLLAQVDGISPK